MTNDDRTPPLARLLLALARAGLPRPEAAGFSVLAEPLAAALPLRRLPGALLRLRRHLHRPGDRVVRRRRPSSGPAPAQRDPAQRAEARSSGAGSSVRRRR